jgi:hypothetical protein
MNDHNRLRVFRAWIALSLGVAIWAESGSPPRSYPGVSECQAQGCPDEESPSAAEQVMENPETYLGCRIVVQGILYRIQGVHQIIYSIKGRSGLSLEVWPWAPDEGGRSQKAEESEEDGQSMPSYVGQELRIEGRLVREKSGRIVLEASIVEELKGGTP